MYVTRHGNPSVIASFGGNPSAPGWLLNIRDNPNVSVQIGGVRRRGVARIASEDERLELWPRFVDVFPGYQRYQARTNRIFPIVIIARLEHNQLDSV